VARSNSAMDAAGSKRSRARVETPVALAGLCSNWASGVSSCKPRDSSPNGSLGSERASGALVDVGLAGAPENHFTPYRYQACHFDSHPVLLD